MRWILALAGLGVLAALAPSRAGGNDAGELFQARCANCHAVPDPAVRTDLAWLGQVKRTS